MTSRDYYKVTYNSKDASKMSSIDSQDILDNDTEFNANQFKLFDDFTTDLRINFNPLRNNYTRNYQDICDANSTRHYQETRTEANGTRNFQDVKEGKVKIGDPNDSGVDMENGNPLDDITASNDGNLVSQ